MESHQDLNESNPPFYPLALGGCSRVLDMPKNPAATHLTDWEEATSELANSKAWVWAELVVEVTAATRFQVRVVVTGGTQKRRYCTMTEIGRAS